MPLALLAVTAVSAYSSYSGAKQARQGEERSAAIQQAQYEQTREDVAPWREAGERALAMQEEYTSPTSYQTYLESLDPQKFQETPYYNFLREEGVRARDRSASSRGMLLSGAQQRSIEEYGQGLASTEYGNYFDRQRAIRGGRLNELSSLAGTGQQTSLELGRIGAGAAQNIGESYAAGGLYRGTGTLGIGKAVTSGIGKWMGAG